MTRLLLDIEGTTTTIAFVHEVLFPYAARAIPAYCAAHWEDLAEIRQLILADAEGAERTLDGREAVLAIVRRQMAQDAKSRGLKALQGLVWAEGYRSGALHAHVFPDVPLALARWRQEGRPVAIYSSGSVLAQQLLFGHSIAGDLTPLIARYFDTAVGAKREPASYARIAAAWGCEAHDILFATDIPAEAEAARAAGCRAVLLLRPGNAPLPPHTPFAVHGDLQRL